MDKSHRMEVARNILEQLGGNGFIAMTGAENLLAVEGGLTFKLPSDLAKDGINYVEIKLTPMDTYTVKFMNVRMQRDSAGRIDFDNSVTLISEHEDIYNDVLRGLFERATGLRTSLTAIYA